MSSSLPDGDLVGREHEAAVRILMEWAEAGRERIAAYRRCIEDEQRLIDGWERLAALGDDARKEHGP